MAALESAAAPKAAGDHGDREAAELESAAPSPARRMIAGPVERSR